MPLKAKVYEAKEVTLDTNFFKDEAGALYRLYDSGMTGTLYAVVVSADRKTIKRDEIVTSVIIDRIKPATNIEFLEAVIQQAQNSLSGEIGAALGEPIDAVSVTWLTSAQAEEAAAESVAEAGRKEIIRKAIKIMQDLIGPEVKTAPAVDPKLENRLAGYVLDICNTTGVFYDKYDAFCMACAIAEYITANLLTDRLDEVFRAMDKILDAPGTSISAATFIHFIQEDVK